MSFPRPMPSSVLVSLRQSLPPLRRAVKRHRRILAVLFGITALLLLMHALTPVLTPGAPTVVAARPLPTGTTPEPKDLTVVNVPLAARPEHAFRSLADVPQAVPLASQHAERQPLTPDSMASEETAVPPGHAFVPIPLPNSAFLGFIHEGSAVALTCPDPTGESTETITGTVVSAPPEQAEEALSPLSTTNDAIIVVSIPRPKVATIANCTFQAHAYPAVVG